MEEISATGTESAFFSAGQRCAGTLYLPSGVTHPPVVVMGHGLGALRCFGLVNFARFFTGRGLAVFTFDYRHWGDSAGEPRQLLVPRRQLQDWHAALAHVRALAQVDGERLGIWGSSFGGAHVIHVAAQDHSVKAVVAQVPAADTASAVLAFGPAYLFKSTVAGMVDAVRGVLGMHPRYFPLVGRPGDTAVMNTAECWDGYLGLVPDDAPWENQVTARSLLLLPFYRAIKVAAAVAAPTLLMAGTQDSLVSIDDVRALAAKLPNGQLQEVDCNHFQPYYPPYLATFGTSQADFFVDKL